MKKVIHVHQAKLKKGEPAVIVRTYKGSQHFSKVHISGPSTMIHSAEPDRCGARAWIETEAEVTGINTGERVVIK
jgi:hypothetical protein